MEKKKEEIYYAELTNPIEVRRSILETSKDLISALEGYEKFKATRKEKSENIVKLKRSLNDVYKLMLKLNENLPKVKIKKIKGKKRKAEPEAVMENVVEKPAEPKRELTELEKLEKELSEVEEKLNSLS